ncbi:zinc-ribbon domain-containing protein [Desulfovibrio sp. OttesenSCG-928-G11]|nr:zinc-ribbon domain-containing protein [Desulfovibrio sp. OttesenSCG-928-G11]
MIIRCPHCEHTRSISEGKIPAQAEYATCPKCRHRFLFRSLPRDVEAEARPSSAAASAAAMEARKQSGEDRHHPLPQAAGPEVLRPQEAFRESAEQRDIWDAMDALHQRWEAQLDQHVTEVEQPRPARAEADAETFFPTASPPAGQEPPGAAPAAAAPPAPARAPLQPPSQPPSQAPVRQPAAPEPVPAPAQTAPKAPAQPPSQPASQAPAPVKSKGERQQAAADSGRNPDLKAEPDSAEPRLTDADNNAETAAENSAEAAGTASGSAGAPPSEQAVRPRFPVYGENGPDPEERVEKDMAMLRAASASGPMRDLGRLREFPDPAQASEAGAEPDDGELLHLPTPEAAPDPDQDAERRTPAWEHARGSRLAAFNATVRGVMFGGPDYFAGMSGGGSLVPGYLFFLLMGYVCILCSLAWRGLAELLMPGLLPPFPRGLVLPALLLLAPAALGLMQLFVTGWIRLLLRLLVPDQADFGLIYKVVSYAVAPFVLSIVPFAGPLLGAAWFMASLTSGCRGALRLSLPLSILLPLPPALLLLITLAWYFL